MRMRIKPPPPTAFQLGERTGASGSRLEPQVPRESASVCLRDDAMVIRGIRATSALLVWLTQHQQKRPAERAHALAECCCRVPHHYCCILPSAGSSFGYDRVAFPAITITKASSRLSSSAAVGILYPRVTDKRVSISHEGVRGKIRQAVLKELHSCLDDERRFREISYLETTVQSFSAD